MGRSPAHRPDAVISERGYQAFLVVIALLLGWSCLRFLLDDPYITYRYAYNLVHGHGLVFNPGERVEGYSNLTWTLLSALAIVLHLSPLVVTKLVGVALAAASAVLGFRLVRHAVPDRELAAALAGLAIAGSPYVAIWGASGLETAAFLAVLLAMLYAVVRGRLIWGAVFAILAVASRVEAVALVGILLVAVLWMRRKVGGQRIAGMKNGRRALWITILGIVALFAARLAYYKALIPNSYTAKGGGNATERIHTGVDYLMSNVWRAVGLTITHTDPTRHGSWRVLLAAEILGIVALALFALYRLHLAERERELIGPVLLLWVAALSAITIWGGGDWMPAFRFGVPLIAYTWVGFAASLTPGREPGRFARPLAIIALLVIVVGGVEQGQQVNDAMDRAGTKASIPFGTAAPPTSIKLSDTGLGRSYGPVAGWLNKHVTPGQTVAIEEAGLIPYETPQLRYLDLLALTDKHLAHAPGQPPFGKRDPDYVMSRSPDWVVVWGDFSKGIQTTAEYDLLGRPDFNRVYHAVCVIQRTAGTTFQIYQRTASPVSFTDAPCI